MLVFLHKIEKLIKRFVNMSSLSLVKVTHLKTAKVSLSKPLYWKSAKSLKECIIFVKYNTNKIHYIIKYDIEHDKYHTFAKTSQSFNLFKSRSVPFLDTTRDKLCMVNMFDKDSVGYQDLYLLDLNTAKWTVSKSTFAIPEHVSSINVINPRFHVIDNKLHFIHCNRMARAHYASHDIFDLDEKKFDAIEIKWEAVFTVDKFTSECSSAICEYLPSSNKFLCFSKWFSLHISTLDLNEENLTWKEKYMPDKAPGSSTYTLAKTIKGFESIIYCVLLIRSLVIGKGWTASSKILCFDAIEETWYESKKNLPSYMTGFEIESFISVGGEYMHYYDPRNGRHDRICLWDLSPKALQIKIEGRMKNEWEVYVFGYVKQEIERKCNMHIPGYLKSIVFMYYTKYGTDPDI